MSWEIETLADIARGGLFTDGDWVESKDQDSSGGVRLTQLADVGVGVFRDRSNRWMREDQALRLNCTFLRPHDILIARMPDPIGRACLVPHGIERAVTVVDVAVLRIARQDLDPRFVMWALNSPNVRARVESMQSGTTRKRISRRNLAAIGLSVPPVIEQQRIVDMIEDQFSRLDAAERGLDVVIARTASLVQRALADASFGAELVPLADLAAIQSGIQKQPKRRPSRNTAPFLRVANITASGLDLAELHEVEMFAGDQERYQLLLGDLLVVEGNGSANQIGRAALWDNSVPGAVHQNHLIRVRPGPRLLPAYLEAVWNAPQLRRQLSSVASSSSGLYTLSVRKLSALGIPVPSRAHQAEVVQRIALVREVAGRLRAEVMAAQHRSKLLRRAVLAYAFSGQLTGATFDAARIEESLAAQ